MQIYSEGDKLADLSVVSLTDEIVHQRIDEVWWSDPNLSSNAIMEADHHWKWRKIFASYSHPIYHACIAIQSEEGYLEGAMAYQYNFSSKIEIGKQNVYIGWLATAPRNRPWLVAEPPYRGIGSALTYLAVRASYKAGLSGRISLQSLPTPRTRQFYEKKGFVRTDLTQSEANLIDYELPQIAAVEWLRKEGDLI